MSGEDAQFSIATKTLKLRKPVRKVEASAAPLGLSNDESGKDKGDFQVPSADLLIGPGRPEHQDEVVQSSDPLESRSGAEPSDTPQENERDTSSTASTSGGEEREAAVSRPTGRPVPYQAPNWSGCPAVTHGLEVIKNGRLLQTIDLSRRAYTVFGRAGQCDVEIEHPSASRYHAVLQCRPSSSHGDASSSSDQTDDDDEEHRDEFYVYDLGSSNNTFVNKEKIKPKTYYRVRLGHQVRFGFSTRMYVLVAGQPDTTAAMIEADAAEEEREVLEERLRKAREFGRNPEATEPASSGAAQSGRIIKHKDDPNAITWGFQEDDVEEEAVMEERPDFEALQSARNGKAQYFEKDPKKALEAFFDREGLDMEFDTDESGSGSKHVFIGRIKLPIQTAMGNPVYGEGSASKKKDAIAAAALDACRLLDAQGMLREHQHEKGMGRKRRPDDEDFYDSDEDSFLDRTGTAEKKRKKRMDRSVGKTNQEEVLTHESLKSQLEDIQNQLKEAEGKLAKAVAAERIGDESLDDFMSSVSNRLDRSQRAKLRNTIAELKKEEARVDKLVALTAPTALPELKAPVPISKAEKDVSETETASASSGADEATAPPKKKAFGFVGTKRGARGSQLRVPVAPSTAALKPVKVPSNTGKEFEEDEEEDVQAPIKNEATAGSDCEEIHPSTPPPAAASELSVPSPSKSKISLPSSPVDPDQSPSSENAVSKSAKRRKRRQHAAEQSLSSAMSSVKAAVEEDALDDWKRDPNVDAWLPPQNQTGDGTTHLNAKFGY